MGGDAVCARAQDSEHTVGAGDGRAGLVEHGVAGGRAAALLMRRAPGDRRQEIGDAQGDRDAREQRRSAEVREDQERRSEKNRPTPLVPCSVCRSAGQQDP